MRRTRRFLITVLVVAALGPNLVAGPAQAAPALTATIDMAPVMTVGQPDTIGIDIANTSTLSEAITVTEIRFVPACASVSNGCQTVDHGHLADDQRVFGVHSHSSQGLESCADTLFIQSEPSAGTIRLAGVFTLAAGEVCRVVVALEAITTPLVDVEPGVPGVQTTAVVEATTTAPGVRAVGVDTVTVERYTPILGMASDPVITAGTPLRASGHVLRASVRPGDWVTFRLFADAACTVPLLDSTVLLDDTPLPAAEFATTTPGTYRWRVSYSGDASNLPLGPTACGDPDFTQTIVPGGHFVPLTPARIEDTRLAVGGLTAPLGPGVTAEVQVTGRGGVPATGVSAVVLNTTVTQPTAGGWLTLHPAGTPRPTASNLNFVAGQTVPNLVVVKVGAGGKVAVFNSAGTTQVILDVAGYYTDRPAVTGGFEGTQVSRIADSRTGVGGAVRLGPGSSIDVQVSGRGGVPDSGVQAAALNVAVTGATASSYLTVYPTGEPRPVASNLNFAAGDTVSNRTMTKLGAGGKVTIFNAAGSTDVIVDVGGWYSDWARAPYAPVEPARILDTRLGVGGMAGPLAAGTEVSVQVAGQGGVPLHGASAFVLNVTVTEPAGPGWLSLRGNGEGIPGTSDVNYASGETRPNLVVVRPAYDDPGRVRLYTSATAHVVIDVAGYFT
jgi:hypothetical protein